MSWQHWVVAVALALCVLTAPLGVGERQPSGRTYSSKKAISASFIALAFLVLLVWGQ